MTQQEIQERNEQIALMLGAIHSIHAEAWGLGNAKNIGSKMFHGVMYKDVIEAQRFEKELKFHSDWNWLMEAVEFISKNGFTYSIYKNDKLYCCSIRIDRTISDFILIKNKSQKEAVFIAVSDFAKKFNNKEL
jgi:hypothetical protein